MSRSGQSLRACFFVADKRSCSFTFWAVFMALVLGPLLALSTELGCIARAASEVQKPADAAALAAVREVNVTLWREEAQCAFLPSACGLAQEYAGREDLLGQSTKTWLKLTLSGRRITNTDSLVGLDAPIIPTGSDPR